LTSVCRLISVSVTGTVACEQDLVAIRSMFCLDLFNQFEVDEEYISPFFAKMGWSVIFII
jgi:hypothetical protein